MIIKIIKIIKGAADQAVTSSCSRKCTLLLRFRVFGLPPKVPCSAAMGEHHRRHGEYQLQTAYQDFYTYPLVNIQKTMENHHF